MSTQRQRRAALLRERRRLVRTIEPSSCPRCHREPVCDPHELTRRSQSSTSAADGDEIVPLGRNCHQWVTEHPVEAEIEGWARWGMRTPTERDHADWLDRL